MPETLALTVLAVSVLAPIGVALWFPGWLLPCLRQALVLAALVAVLALVSATAASIVLAAVASGFLLLCLYERRFTLGASVLVWLVTMIVIARYPPTWVLTMAFLLGWAHFAGSLRAAAASAVGAEGTRDVTDLAPLVAVVVFGAALLEGEQATVGLVVFCTISFIVNDVLSSDLGPLLPGRARLLPRPLPVPHGTPGAMSDGGTLLGAAGSLCAGLCAGAVMDDPAAGVAVALAGVVAGVVDSVLSRIGSLRALSRGNELVNSAGCLVAVAVGVLLFTG